MVSLALVEMERDDKSQISPFDIDAISRRGNLRDALNLALEEIKSGSLEIDLYFIAASIAFRLGDLGKAEQLTNRLLVLDPEHVRGWLLFGEIYARKNDIVRAAHARQMAETLFPALAKIDNESVYFFEEVENENKSVKEPKESLNFDTVTYADICARQGYYNKALKIYQDHLRKNPDNEELKKKIADIEKRLKND
ncbi:MAG: tetratricopeptide repeat protein [Candidatus Zixiibacteriota bacterium]|nr:MAG: tetratricopeptide repeat protein [candidate division Zixibacteria bacterium]